MHDFFPSWRSPWLLLEKVDTRVNRGDCLTKPLGAEDIQHPREMMGIDRTSMTWSRGSVRTNEQSVSADTRVVSESQHSIFSPDISQSSTA